MISLDEFVKNIEEEIEDLEPGVLTATVNYRDLENWSSMYALIIIAYIDTEFDVTVSGEDLRECSTVGSLYELVKSRV